MYPGHALHARTVDAPFLRRLETGRFHGRVQSVFEGVVNIEHAGGELFTLGCRALDNGPNTAIVDIAGFGRTGIAVNDRVAGADGELRVGYRNTVVLATASAWEGSLPTYPGANGRLRTHLRLARSYLHRHGEGGGMVAHGGAETEFALEVMAALEHRATLLIKALSQANHACACRHAKSMIGLGPGLTPSGDDFLGGLFAVLNVAGSPCHGWLGGGTDVVAGAERLTNAISLAALTQAAAGRVRESIATLIESLMSGTPEGLIESLRRVLAIGSTSGADLVAGILSGFELNLRVGASRTCQ
jgi:hypothetical protein